MENLNGDKTNKKSKKWLFILLAIVVIAVLIGGYYFYNSSKPKNVFVSQINKAVDSYNEAYTNTKETLNETVTLTGAIESQNAEIQQVADYIKDGKLTMNVQADTNSKKTLVSLDVDYKNEKLLGGKVYYAVGDNNFYIFVQDLFDKYLKVDLSKTLNQDELQEVQNLLDARTGSVGEKVALSKTGRIVKKEIKTKLEEKYFSKENVDGMTNNTMKLTVEELRKGVSEVVTNLANNEEFISCYKNAEQEKKGLEEFVKNINGMTEYDNYNVEISLFTKGLSTDIKKLEVKVVKSETEEGTFTVNKVDADNYEFYLEVKGSTNNVLVNAQALKGTISREKIDDNTGKITLVVDNIPDVGKVTLNMEVKMEDKTELDSVDVTNSVDLETMSQQDMLTLYTNLTKMRAYSLFGSFMQ